MLNVPQIQELTPHRWPFLFVDKIVELEPGVRAVGIKAVTYNEWFMPGHALGFPVMPGVITVEASAQVGVLLLQSTPEYAGQGLFFAEIKNYRFRKPILPGDTMRMEFTFLKAEGKFITGAVKVTVDGEIAADGEVTYALAGMPMMPKKQ